MQLVAFHIQSPDLCMHKEPDSGLCYYEDVNKEFPQHN